MKKKKKVCSKCDVPKELDQFHKNKSSKDGLSNWCINCQKNHKKEHYQENKDKYKQNSINNRKWLIDLKSNLSCEECGEDHVACLDFHHIDPEEKEFEINFSSFKGKTKEEILEEIKKCIILCSNCHRKLHWNKNHGSMVE